MPARTTPVRHNEKNAPLFTVTTPRRGHSKLLGACRSASRALLRPCESTLVSNGSGDVRFGALCGLKSDAKSEKCCPGGPTLVHSMTLSARAISVGGTSLLHPTNDPISRGFQGSA